VTRRGRRAAGRSRARVVASACCCRSCGRGVRLGSRPFYAWPVPIVARRPLPRLVSQRHAAARLPLRIRVRAGLLPRGRVVGVREPARLRLDARAARRRGDIPLLRLLALFPAAAGWATLRYGPGGARTVASRPRRSWSSSGCAAGSSPDSRGSTSAPRRHREPARGVRAVVGRTAPRSRSRPRPRPAALAAARGSAAPVGRSPPALPPPPGGRTRSPVEWTHPGRAPWRWRSCRATSRRRSNGARSCAAPILDAYPR
jgi:hypothetical protein